MYKKLGISGLVLLIAGAAALSWSLFEKNKEQKQADFYSQKYASETEGYIKQYNEWLQKPAKERSQLPWGLDEYGKTETKAQLQQKQQERLKANLDKLAAGETDVYPLADILYGENWQEELSKYESRKNQRELIFTCSVVCTSAGGAVFSGCLLLWTARLIIRVLSSLKRLSANLFKNTKETLENRMQRTGVKKDEEEHLKVLVNSGWHNLDVSSSGQSFRNSARNNEKASIADRGTWGFPKTAVQLSGGNPVESKETVKVSTEGFNLNATPVKCSAKNVQQSTIEHSEPLGNHLRELTQQISAIRDYAYQQQDRVEKLQDGYDWGIIRTFCLRVIRCIENLEERINKLSEQNAETVDLREFRDELLFALESSGIERFEPEIDSDYRGQEKYAEAVKERESSNVPNMTAKIARVIRPGYQYIIDHGDIKVVCKAKVKLYN